MMPPMQPQNLKPDYQVVIVGAGPAGSICALRLSQLGIDKVLLVEKGDLQGFVIGESIPPEANNLLRELNIYEEFLQQKHLPCYGSKSCWGSERAGFNDFLLNPNGHGWHLDRVKFNNLLSTKAKDAGAELLLNTSLHSAEKVEGKYKIQLKEKSGKLHSVNADMVVDASGARGIFARSQGSEKKETLPLLCLSMRFRPLTKIPTISGLTHVETTKNGWWYAAALPENQILVAIYTDADNAKSYGLKEPDNWMKQLEQTSLIAPLLRSCERIDLKPSAFFAPSRILHPLTGDNWLAVGDAASAYDPLTSAGIMKSMIGAKFAAEQIAQKITGQITDFSAYKIWVQQEFGMYLKTRTRFYKNENRWSEAAFWKKMQEERVVIKI